MPSNRKKEKSEGAKNLAVHRTLEETVSGVNLLLHRKRRDTFVQSLGLAAFLFGIIAAAMTIALSEGDAQTTYVTMFFITCAGIALAAFRFRYVAMILGGLQILAYAVYQLYGAVGSGKEIVLLDYVWLLLPLLCISSMVLFMMNMHKVETLAEMLEEQIQNMEVIEPVTGLNNLRSMYMDLERQMAYAQRNSVELALIILELRYYQELKSILSNQQFSELRQRMGRLVEESLRLEDRVYAIDDKGSLGVVCVGCGSDGAVVVKNRIIAMLGQQESFEGILDRKLRVDVRAGFYCYDREEIKNAIEFKQKAENELQYDV